MKKAFIAGPDLLVPDAANRADAIRAICLAHGLQALLPASAAEAPHEEPHLVAAWIAGRNKAMLRDADVLVANASPFRGPSMEPSTAFAIGFAHALGIPVVCWSNKARDYITRVPGHVVDDRAVDFDDLTIEDFGLPDVLAPVEAASSWTHSGESGPWHGEDGLKLLGMALAKASMLIRMATQVARQRTAARTPGDPSK